MGSYDKTTRIGECIVSCNSMRVSLSGGALEVNAVAMVDESRCLEWIYEMTRDQYHVTGWASTRA